MPDPRSAPCKARRFAPPAHVRGLRALTVPARRSGPGNHEMVGGVMMRSWTDLGLILTVDRDSDRRYLSLSPCSLHPPRDELPRGALTVGALSATTYCPLPDFSTDLNRGRTQCHFEIRDSKPHGVLPSVPAAARAPPERG